MRKMNLITAAVAAVSIGLAAGFAQAEPLKIRMSYVVPIGNWGSILYHKKDVMKHYGKSYEVQVTRFRGTSLMITALGAGELDVADLAYSSFSIAVQNAGMNDLKVIADEVQDGVKGHRTGEYWVLKDGPIKTIKDLKGQILASVGPGTAVDIAMRAMLKKSGLEAPRDYTMVSAHFPSMKAMLLQKKAALVTMVAPFVNDPEFVAKSRPLFSNVEALGGSSQFIIFAAKDAWLKKNRAVVVDYLEDMLLAIRWYQDPANKDAAMEIFAGILKAPKKIFEYKFTK
ncbi:MAG: ABC transporter substrate-binding protein [Rhodospirillales bacterium]|nr:ABC transporter substrate-binding protein [Rhodospirillales bacterium]